MVLSAHCQCSADSIDCLLAKSSSLRKFKYDLALIVEEIGTSCALLLFEVKNIRHYTEEGDLVGVVFVLFVMNII